MLSALSMGIELLSKLESDSAQSQGKPIESSGKSTSEYIEGITWIPKNVTRLKPIIGELMRKVIIIVI